MSKVSQFFQDDNDRFSATRLAFLAWIFGALIVWGAGSCHDRKMQDLPSSIQVLIGILMTGKVTQKFVEASGSTVKGDQPSSANDNAVALPAAGNGSLTSVGHTR